MATSVQFVGSVGYSTDYATFTVLTSDGIRNTSTSNSASLRLELWASAAPFSGSFATSYRMAVYTVGPVAAGVTTPKITQVVPFTPPPGGIWYFSMVLTEYTGAAGNDGYVERAHLNFPGTVNIKGTPPPVDTTPPAVSIASPTGGNVSGTVTISANASDNVGVTRVDFYVNGSLAGSDSAAPYQYAWNTASLANGTATLYAKAFDAAGNSAQSASVIVTVANVAAPPVDTTPPTVSIVSPTSGAVSGTVTVTANATDNVGVAWVWLLVNGKSVGATSKAPWSFAWNSRDVSDGPAKIELLAMDAAGNSALSAPVNITVANYVSIASMKLAVEYYNADLDHYFITAMDSEIDALDAGRFAGWYRTGSSLDVYVPGSAHGSPVCRFYLPPQYGDSHFYSASPAECAQVAQKFPGFAYESTEVFRAVTPDLATGACPQNMVPVYRLWNNRIDSNHRYTSDRRTRDEMVAKGYVAEGYGPDPVIMCGAP